MNLSVNFLRCLIFVIAFGLLIPFCFCATQCTAQTVQIPGRQNSTITSAAPADKIIRAKHAVEKIGAITYREIDGESLNCDVYLPDGDGPFPAIVAIHGGAWRQGTKFTMLRHARKLAAAGYVVVAINYRHAPEHKFPAQIHDCKYAVKWMRANATQYKIDAGRIAAYGYSAGGHLAALMATTDANDGLEPDGENNLSEYSSRIKAALVGGAPCEFEWVDENAKTLAYWLGDTRANDPDIYQQASPTNFITVDDPPCYFYHGEFDIIVPKSSSRNMNELLIESGITSEHHIAKGLGHIAAFSDLSWMSRAIDFFDEHVK